MSMKSGADAQHMDRKALIYAGFTAVTITLYTIADGTGARVSGNPVGYVAALFVMEGLLLGVIAVIWRGWKGLEICLDFVPQAIAGATMSGAAYGISIWA